MPRRPVRAGKSTCSSVDDHASAELDEGVASDAAVDADDDTEFSGRAGLHTRFRVLDDGTCLGGQAEELCRTLERVGLGLAGQAVASGDGAVDDDLEAIGQPRCREHRRRVLRAGHDGDLRPGALDRVEEGDARRVGFDALLGEGGVEGLVLAVAESVHGVERRGIRHLALGKPDAATLEQRAHPVVPGLSVDVGEVVVVGVRLGAVRLQERREQACPRVHVHDRGGREHAVEVEQPAPDAAEIEVPRVGRGGLRVWGRGGGVGGGHGRPFGASVGQPDRADRCYSCAAGQRDVESGLEAIMKRRSSRRLPRSPRG